MALDDVPDFVKLQPVPLLHDFQRSDESAIAFLGAVCEYHPQSIEDYFLDPTGDDYYECFEGTLSDCAERFLELRHDARWISSAGWQHLRHDREKIETYQRTGCVQYFTISKMEIRFQYSVVNRWKFGSTSLNSAEIRFYVLDEHSFCVFFPEIKSN